MKRVDLIRHLERCGCEFFRYEGNHREVNDFLARKICADLQIPRP